MRRVGLLAVMVVQACFTIPDFAGGPSPGELDEDGDGIPNATDLCPSVRNGSDPEVDSDGDGVGNACDPNPGLQDMHFFYSFDGLAMGDLTTTGGGRVQPSDSFVEIGAIGSDVYSVLLVPHALSKTQIDIRYAIMDAADSPKGGVGVITGNYDSDDPTHGGNCVVDLEPNDDTRLTAVYTPPANPVSMETRVDVTFRHSGRLQGNLGGTQLGCLADQLATISGDEFPPITTSVTLGDAAPAGQPGVFANNSIVTIEYIFVAGLP